MSRISHTFPVNEVPVPAHDRRRVQITCRTLSWLLIITAATLIILPRLIGLYYLQRAVAVIEAVDQGNHSADALHDAIADLHIAAQWPADKLAIYTQLANAYALAAKQPERVDALEQLYRLQPDSLLVSQDLAEAYEAVGAFPRADAVWAGIGISPQEMVTLGDRLFATGNSVEAIRWYGRAARRGVVLNQDSLFKVSVTAIITHIDIGIPLQSDRLPAYQLVNGATKIDGPQLRWLHGMPALNIKDGDLLAGTLIGERGAGIMWWPGMAVARVDVPEAGRYTITLCAQQSAPAPIELQLEHNGSPVGQITLSRGDESWQEYSYTLDLSAGPHVIGVSFLNNSSADGLDRNAAIDWLRIEPGI